MDKTSYRPDRKIVAAALAAIVVWVAQLTAGLDIPPGIESAVAVLVGYLIPTGAEHPEAEHEPHDHLQEEL